HTVQTVPQQRPITFVFSHLHLASRWYGPCPLWAAVTIAPQGGMNHEELTSLLVDPSVAGALRPAWCGAGRSPAPAVFGRPAALLRSRHGREGGDDDLHPGQCPQPHGGRPRGHPAQ